MKTLSYFAVVALTLVSSLRAESYEFTPDTLPDPESFKAVPVIPVEPGTKIETINGVPFLASPETASGVGAMMDRFLEKKTEGPGGTSSEEGEPPVSPRSPGPLDPTKRIHTLFIREKFGSDPILAIPDSFGNNEVYKAPSEYSKALADFDMLDTNKAPEVEFKELPWWEIQK